MAQQPPTEAFRKLRFLSHLMLGLSLLTFAIFFLNVLIGGPLRSKPWMNDVQEMLTLFFAVVFFVAGTLAREAQARLNGGQKPPGGVPPPRGTQDIPDDHKAQQGIKPV